jgi:hypothetical protein
MLPTAYRQISNILGPSVNMSAVPFETFCEAVQLSNIPLSESETFMLAKLFSRTSPSVLNDTGTVDADLLENVRRGILLSMRLQ